MRCQREATGRGGLKTEIRPSKKHGGVANTFAAEPPIRQGACGGIGREHEVEIVIVPRHALPLLSQFAAPLEPRPKPVDDHDLVPEGAFREDRRDGFDRQIEGGNVVRDVRCQGNDAVRIQR